MHADQMSRFSLINFKVCSPKNYFGNWWLLLKKIFVMENNSKMIEDLKELINIANDGKEGYLAASEATDSIVLKTLFLKFSAERAVYAEELKSHLLKHGTVYTNENGGLLGVLHRTWLDIKNALSSKEHTAILSAIESGENVALEKYEKAMQAHEADEEHYYLLKTQRDGILNALKAMETLHIELKN
jgi:uncharacterized protein (TIGR02284 family)